MHFHPCSVCIKLSKSLQQNSKRKYWKFGSQQARNEQCVRTTVLQWVKNFIFDVLYTSMQGQFQVFLIV